MQRGWNQISILTSLSIHETPTFAILLIYKKRALKRLFSYLFPVNLAAVQANLLNLI